MKRRFTKKVRLHGIVIASMTGMFAVSPVLAQEATKESTFPEQRSALTASSLAASDTKDAEEKPKKGFVDRLPQPIRWIAKNWSDFDPNYSLPSFYNWAFHIQNSNSWEWINMETPQGVELNMRSRGSVRLGPYFGWRFLFFGATVDLSTLGKGADNRKDEFTLSINSNLFNIDLIRRRTGSDFIMHTLNYTDPVYGRIGLKSELELNNVDLGDFTKNSLTGVNINYFINHRKYSNPAAFTQGAVQLRSVGSPIVGLGYTHQKVETESATLFGTLGLALLNEANGGKLIDEKKYYELEQLYENNPSAYDAELSKILRAGWPKLSEIPEGNTVRSFLTNLIPTTTTIDDWHVQLGYAYNVVFSRRLLLGMSAILSPGLKRVRSDNSNSYISQKAETFRDIIRDVEKREVSADDFRYRFSDTYINLNGFFKASLTYNYDRWRAGLIASFSNYYYKHNGMKIYNHYGNFDIFVGYCFGRKKEYRHNGELRKDYIMAALSPRHIIELTDTMPKGNIGLGATYVDSLGKTSRYHTDKFEIAVNGCELACGPEGKYGWYEVEDGYVTPSQDTEGRLQKGTVLEIGKDGSFEVTAGHSRNFRTGNWWKSQLDVEQIPGHRYPDKLHYALSGKLTLYLRGSLFGTDGPVKLEIDDFCVNHGKNLKDFYQVGVKSFTSGAANRIEGETRINNRPYHISIEQKRRGKPMQIAVSPAQ